MNDERVRNELLASYERGVWLFIAIAAASLVSLIAFLAYILL